MVGKKKLLARGADWSGAIRMMEFLPSKLSLIVLNYHRIGAADRTPYDSGTYSATTADFSWQVAHLQKRFPIINLSEATDIVHGRSKPGRPCILLTFDDAYLDNYDEAFPVLRKHRACAAFFLPTAFVGTGTLPWWDTIACIAKNTRHHCIALTYPHRATFDLSPLRRLQSIMRILTLFKSPAVVDRERFIADLENACAHQRPNGGERCFLNWNEARQMRDAGMSFGSHTHTHEILSKLPAEGQLVELQTSRRILERELDSCVDTLAYPVGSRTSFSDATVGALYAANYRTAFSKHGGINIPGTIDPSNVLRVGISGEDRSTFKLRLALLAARGESLV